jgi:hypothetical protein
LKAMIRASMLVTIKIRYPFFCIRHSPYFPKS